MTPRIGLLAGAFLGVVAAVALTLSAANADDSASSQGLTAAPEAALTTTPVAAQSRIAAHTGASLMRIVIDAASGPSLPQAPLGAVRAGQRLAALVTSQLHDA